MVRTYSYVNPDVLYGRLTLVPAVALMAGVVMVTGWGWPAAWLVAINLIAFCMYGYDKLIAGTSVVRVPERILLAQVLLGAVVLAPVACWLFHHKTHKSSFRARLWIAELVALAWVGGLSYLHWLI